MSTHQDKATELLPVARIAASVFGDERPDDVPVPTTDREHAMVRAAIDGTRRIDAKYFALVDTDVQRRMEELASMGLATEVICHDVNADCRAINDTLDAWAKDAGNRANQSFLGLCQRWNSIATTLGFLQPLQHSDYRRDVSGAKVATYVIAASARMATYHKTTVTVTDAFRAIEITTSNLFYTVVLNMVNNALYWSQFTPDGRTRDVIVDYIDGVVLVSDNGPGVAPADVPRLFTPFFSRRAMGRGIGLYACRQHVENSGGTIEYVTDDGPLKRLPGANFAIRFHGVKETK